MKNNIFTLIFFLPYITVFTQDLNLNYEVRGAYTHPITKGKLSEAKVIGDLIPYYPTSWIMSYVSVEILATCNGKSVLASGTNETLSKEQKNILYTADLGTDIVIDIDYKYKNVGTDLIEIRKIHYAASVIPEIEAEYLGGNEQMTQYLKENAINKISQEDSKQIKMVSVRFFVTEQGEIADAQISKTSGDEKIDKLLLETINKMPKWRPAENSKGIKVRQQFQFNVGKGGC